MEKTTKVISKVTNPISGWIRLIINVFALMTSWFFNKSILWAIFHFLFGFWYLVYRLMSGAFRDGGFIQIVNYYF